MTAGAMAAAANLVVADTATTMAVAMAVEK